MHHKIIPFSDLASWRNCHDNRLVVTNGCFDILHTGHCSYLEHARSLGSALLVGINDDNGVRTLKGYGRPVNNQDDRALVIASLECVDGVCIFPGSSATEFLQMAQPNIYVKGGDYTLEAMSQLDREVLVRLGSRIEFIPLTPGKSTTAILKQTINDTNSFFVFDVESVGLHGEGFAVAGGVYLSNGSVQWEFCFACPADKSEGLQADRDWVARNVPALKETHRGPLSLRLAFWEMWEKAKSGGAEMAAECLWPVEARFLRDCISDDAQRLPTAPYPCHEIASVMLSAGMTPMATYDRTPSEMPRHNPLADARQSARLLSEAISRIKRQ